MSADPPVHAARTPPEPPIPGNPFADLDAYLALPRIGGLALSPDGSRLVVGVSTLRPDRTGRDSALWEVDPGGDAAPRRLTRSAEGESAGAFAADGSLLFTSSRPIPPGALPGGDPETAESRPEGKPGTDRPPVPALWLLPASGEARPVATRPGGITGLVAARDAAVFAVTSPTLAAAGDAADDARRRTARETGKVSAILHTGYPVRYWDADLGPAGDRLLAGRLPDPDSGAELRDLTPDAGVHAVREATADLSPDGTTLITEWRVPQAHGESRVTLIALDTATAARRPVLDGIAANPDDVVVHGSPAISPDGRTVAAVWETRSTPTEPPDRGLEILAIDGTGTPTRLAPAWDRWPSSVPVWAADGSALFVTADDNAAGPVFRVSLDPAADPVRLTGDDGAYADLAVAPDGSAIYALRSSWDSPPQPVRLDPTTADQSPVSLPSPAPAPAVPGRLVRLAPVRAADGALVHSRLVLPAGAGPADPVPLVLWVHGGPLGSWNAWSWRWTPWVLAAHGYAVLLPDPALSTGYGRQFIGRGWGRWGEVVADDVLRVTDAVVARDDIDAERTAMMGGSFGGYLANWLAGHTDRFSAIVSHAGLWALDQFGETTDASDYWRREMSAQAQARNTPHTAVDAIVTPMLVIHGDRDYRVPISEALRLWSQLGARATAPDGSMPHRFLYFPQENHWVLAPLHSRIWYATVLAFLDQHVRGMPWRQPDLLG